MREQRRIPAASEEFAGASLGDARLTRRLQTVADAIASGPAKSFPELCGSDSELEGVYRFVGNQRVNDENILAPHIAATLERARGREVLSIEDTTGFMFGGESPREGLGWIHKEGASQGFFAHAALAVDLGTRRPLGILGLQTFVRTGEPLGRRASRAARRQRSTNERDRWVDLAIEVHERVDALHVMDREADSFDIFEQLLRVQARFVIRVRDARNRVTLESGERAPIQGQRVADPIHLTRTVSLSRRPTSGRMPRDKIHPPRKERTAKLEIRARTVAVPRPTTYSRLVLPRSIPVNVVSIDEVAPPPGVEPVCWKLFTNEPIETPVQIERIVDAYRARWLIEEYFKVLKTGCAVEKRQLESFHALKNALAMFAVIAWRLLLLRSVARATPKAPASHVLTRRQLTVLRALEALNEPRFRRIALPDKPTSEDAALAIAALGGHRRNNGHPGWQVLGRGYDALLLLEVGWSARDAM
jgi:hypothetical protein